MSFFHRILYPYYPLGQNLMPFSLRIFAPLMLIGLSLILGACSNPSTKAYIRLQDSLTIESTTHVLDNGLTLIIHEDHSDPLVHVDVTYHVGSAREELGRSGFAHLFEHMMFQGSKHVDDEEHFKIINQAGGRANGTTNRDRTNYYETVPSNHLEPILWLEADRMGFFLEGITQEKFEIQRATVKNEKKQNYGNRSYGRTSELINKSLYEHDHPYHWLTIGELEDLDNATAEDLQRFFLHWYGPNNATITIGGDVDTQDAIALVTQYFGSIPKGQAVIDQAPKPSNLSTDQYISYVDKNIHFPALVVTFPSVPRFHADAMALNCLSEILSGGKDSYLYQNFIANAQAMHMSSRHTTDELAGEFTFFAIPASGKNLPEFEQDIRQSLAQFANRGISQDDVDTFKARFETKFIQGLETVQGKVSQLAYYQTFAGSPNYYQTTIEEVEALTVEDIQRVYKKYIEHSPSLTLSVLANIQQSPAQQDSIDLDERSQQRADHIANNTPSSPQVSYQAPKDTFDRSIQPQAKPAKLASPPRYWTRHYTNGLNVIGTQSNELPTITLQLAIDGGANLDSLDPSKLGLASLSVDLLNGSTQNYSEKEISQALNRLGSRISFSSDSQKFYIRVHSLTKNMDETLKLLEEKLMRPAFDQTEFDVKKKQFIEFARASNDNADAIASLTFDKLLYGEKHIMGMPNFLAEETLKTISLDDVKHFYHTFITPVNANLVFVGNVDADTISEKLTFLTSWEKPEAPGPKLTKTPSHSPTTIYYIDKPSAAQAELRIGSLSSFVYEPTGPYYECFLMNYLFGGNFNSRINMNLREDKGITYGARSYCSASEIPGPIAIETTVTTDQAATAIKEIFSEIKRFKDTPISSDELFFLQNSIGQSDALKYESSAAKSNLLGNIIRFNIPKDFTVQRQKIIANLSREKIKTFANTHLQEDNMIILLVGDKSEFIDELQKLPFPLVELNDEGDPLN